MVKTMRSPEFMKRSVAPLGVKVLAVELTGSTPTRFWHDLFSSVPWK